MIPIVGLYGNPADIACTPTCGHFPDLLILHQIRSSIKSIFMEGIPNPFIMTIFLVFSGASCHNKTINV